MAAIRGCIELLDIREPKTESKIYAQFQGNDLIKALFEYEVKQRSKSEMIGDESWFKKYPLMGSPEVDSILDGFTEDRERSEESDRQDIIKQAKKRAAVNSAVAALKHGENLG